MKNLLLIVLLAASSIVYSQNLFNLSGMSLNGETPITFINIYVPAEHTDTWSYYVGNDIHTRNGAEYYMALPIENRYYLLEFVNGEDVKQLYVTTPVSGNYMMNVNFNSNNAGVIYYDQEIANYNFDVGTLDELFGD
tara:strand:+ start:149 stop:559 length:411 start_codon:yes stop_codon:yes gene_type:complete